MNIKIKNNGAFEDLILKGIKGADGKDGISVPSGGTSGQILQKKSNTDYDFSWTTLQATSSVTALVATSSWVEDITQDGYSYKSTVTVAGVTANNNIIVGLSPSSTAAQEEACGSAGLKCKEQGTDFIVIYAKSAPEVDLTINVIILG